MILLIAGALTHKTRQWPWVSSHLPLDSLVRPLESHVHLIFNLFVSFATSGNVPCPIIYGAVVDSACLFWEYSCGSLGACRVYDPSKFRMVFHGVTAVIMFVAFLVDAVVWVKASSIQFHEEDEDEEDVHAALGQDSEPNCSHGDGGDEAVSTIVKRPAASLNKLTENGESTV